MVLKDLKSNLTLIEEYVEKVLLGDLKGDASIGLALKKLLRDIPTFSPSTF